MVGQFVAHCVPKSLPAGEYVIVGEEQRLVKRSQLSIYFTKGDGKSVPFAKSRFENDEFKLEEALKKDAEEKKRQGPQEINRFYIDTDTYRGGIGKEGFRPTDNSRVARQYEDVMQSGLTLRRSRPFGRI